MLICVDGVWTHLALYIYYQGHVLCPYLHILASSTLTLPISWIFYHFACPLESPYVNYH